MKNTRFLQQHKHSRRAITPGQIAAIVLSLGIVWIHPVWLEQGLLSMTSPLWRARSVLAESTAALATHLKSKEELEADNVRLTEENEQLRIKAALYDEVKASADRVEAAIGSSTKLQKIAVGHVIASPAATAYDSLLIDVGASEGVKVGDVVMYGDTIALGRIDLVTAHTSRAVLYTAPTTKHEVYVGTSTAHFEITGWGGGMFAAQIPKDFSVAPNDALTDTTLRQTLGFVRSVDVHDEDAFQTVFAVMPINLFETRDVIIRRSPLNEQ